MEGLVPMGANVQQDRALARAHALEVEVRTHKSVIRRHRAQLAIARAALDEVQRELGSRGIRLVVNLKGVEGEPSWPSRNPSSTSTP